MSRPLIVASVALAAVVAGAVGSLLWAMRGIW